MRGIAEDGGSGAGFPVHRDECRAVDSVVPLPGNREGGVGFLDMDRFGVSAVSQPGGEMIGRVQQPRIAGFGGEQDELLEVTMRPS